MSVNEKNLTDITKIVYRLLIVFFVVSKEVNVHQMTIVFFEMHPISYFFGLIMIHRTMYFQGIAFIRFYDSHPLIFLLMRNKIPASFTAIRSISGNQLTRNKNLFKDN